MSFSYVKGPTRIEEICGDDESARSVKVLAREIPLVGTDCAGAEFRPILRGNICLTLLV